MGVDIGLHPLNYGIVCWKVEDKVIVGFSVERMLSDKLSVIYSKKDLDV